METDQIKADILDYIEFMCDSLVDAEDVDGNMEQTRWRAKGYREIAEMIRKEKRERFST